MNLSRRDFLRALGITASVAAVGLPMTQPAEAATVEQLAVLEIDAPVSQETPFAWLEIDGKRYAARQMALSYHNVSGSNWDSVNPIPLRVELSAELYGGVDSYKLLSDYYGINKLPVSANFSGYGRISTSGYISRMAVTLPSYGSIVELEMILVGMTSGAAA